MKGFYLSKMQPSFSGLATATKKAAAKTGASLRGVFAPKDVPSELGFGERLLEEAAASPLTLLLVLSLVLNVVLLLRTRRKPAANGHVNGRATGQKSSALEALAARRAAAKANHRAPVIGSLTGAVDDLARMKEAFQYKEAGELLDELQKALSQAGSFSWGASDAKARLAELLADGLLTQRIRVAREATESLNQDDGFELMKEDEGKRVLQRLTPDRHLTVKIEAVLEGVSPADCLLIWREAELYPTWFPFISGGKQLACLSAGEVFLHILVETFFMSVDMVLHGWACDNLKHEGNFMLNVRPVRHGTPLPNGLPHPKIGGNGATKVFGALRAHAVIDVLLEPLSETSVRFAFQMSDHVPPFMPSWAINYIVMNAMADIFDKMREVAVKMHAGDPNSPHVQHVGRRSYHETQKWFRSKVGDYVSANL